MFRSFRTSLIALFAALFLASCSIPNLEQPECLQSREPLKQFYSSHFGTDMKPTTDGLEARKRSITPELANRLAASTEAEVDYFTATKDYPKAFRIGACNVVSPERTAFDVVLFWRDDNRSEEKEIVVEMVKQSGVWLLDKVSPK